MFLDQSGGGGPFKFRATKEHKIRIFIARKSKNLKVAS